MNFRLITLIFFIIFSFACKKDKNSNLGGGYSPPEFVFKCDTLPQEPVIGWTDTSANADQDVRKILYNPLNSNEVIFIVKSKNYFSEMYVYNMQTKVSKSIDKSIVNMPNINKYGWLTYCKANYQVYKIKANGDSLTQLTTFSGDDPRWDYTGNNIFYSQNGFGNSPQKVVKINKFGVKLDSLSYQGLTGLSTKSNKILAVGPSSELLMEDLNTHIQTVLKTGSVNYYNLTVDNNDENVFWWDNKGIYQLNINTKVTDTVVKMCKLPYFLDTDPFQLFATNISPKSNYLTFCLCQNKPVSVYKLFHEWHALQMDLFSKKITEIKLF